MRGRFDVMGYLRRRPALMLVVRLLLFGPTFFFMAALGIAQGWVDINPRGCPYHAPPGCDDNIYFTNQPIAFTIVVGLYIFVALFVPALSIIAYLKQSGRLAMDWKLLGLDVRR
jgi:hypothetical protein